MEKRSAGRARRSPLGSSHRFSGRVFLPLKKIINKKKENKPFIKFSLLARSLYCLIKSHGWGDRGEGETQVQPGLSNAADERPKGDEFPAQLQRHLHASGAAAG